MPETAFKDFILDQLAAVRGLRGRAMFGGFGLYGGDRFFGIIHCDRLYFKTDDVSACAYREHGMECFRPNAKQRLEKYLEVPPDVIEDAHELERWARTALAVSRPLPVTSPRSRLPRG